MKNRLSPGKLDGGCINRSRHIGNVILNRERAGQGALGQVPKVEARVDGEDLSGEQAVVDWAEPVWWAVLQTSVLPSKEEPAADLRRRGDDGKEHAGQVEVPEVAGDLHPVVEEGDDGDGEVEGAPNVVALLHMGLVHSRDHQRVSSSSP